MAFRVLVTDKLDKEGIDILKSYKEIEVIEKETMKGDELKNSLKGFDAVIIRSETKMTREVIEASVGLKIISRAGVGVDNVDVAAATEKGIIVVNAPLGNTISTAEYSFAMMIALARKIPFAFASIKRDGVWDRKSFKGVELLNKTLGVIGLGRIGTEVGKRAKAFGMKVLGFDPFVSAELAEKLGFEISTLERIYKESDFITVHSPLTEQTKNMIGKAQIASMKKSVRIINCARGGIINEQDLADALKEGRIAGAAVDVYTREPCFEPRNPLLDAPNLVLAPHLGASTSEAQFNVAVESAEGVANFLLHGMIVNSVNMPSINKEIFEQLKGYISLSEKLGTLISQGISGQIEEVRIVISGNEITERDLSILTRAALKGLFSSFLGDTVNYVNSTQTARSRGIRVIEEKLDNDTEYTNLIRLTVKSDQETMELWGTVYGGTRGKIVNFNGYFFEVDPTGTIVMINNEDKPGVIGKVGTIMGEHGINIASMNVSRKLEKQHALILLNVDADVSPQVQLELNGIKEILKYKIVKLG
jgi:D-3-phosphoglycerate dehydrogenase